MKKWIKNHKRDLLVTAGLLVASEAIYVAVTKRVDILVVVQPVKGAFKPVVISPDNLARLTEFWDANH